MNKAKSTSSTMDQRLAEARKALDGRRVLVTGGAGFLGSNLATRLTKWGARVTILDRVTPEVEAVDRAIEGDVLDPETVEGAVKDQEYVFHMAGKLGVEKILDIPYDVLEVNLQGTAALLKASLGHGVKRFVLASSSEIYGDPKRIPIAETDDKSPISTYGVSKLAAEAYCEAYHQQLGLPTTCVRFFNAFGPGQKERFVIPIFISRVLRGESPVIYGDGSQRRSYTFIDDAINGTILAGFLPEGAGQAFNIGSTEEITIKELADFIISVSGNNLSPQYRPFGQGIRLESREVFQRKPEISKAHSLLGFEVRTSLQEGIRAFMRWCETQPEIYTSR